MAPRFRDQESQASLGSPREIPQHDHASHGADQIGVGGSGERELTGADLDRAMRSEFASMLHRLRNLPSFPERVTNEAVIRQAIRSGAVAVQRHGR